MSNLNISFTSPVCTFGFPKLDAPDTAFNADGVYSVDLILDPNNTSGSFRIGDENFDTGHAGFIQAITEMVTNVEGSSKYPAKNPVLKADNDRDGNSTGLLRLRVSSKAVIQGNAVKPSAFDAQGSPTTMPRVGGGTTGRVAGKLVSYDGPSTGCGISRRLNSVQIVELKEYSVGNEAFGAVEGGTFEANSAAEGTAGTNGGGAYDL